MELAPRGLPNGCATERLASSRAELPSEHGI